MAENRKGLKIAVVHYHLKRGGVTRVIESAKSVLQEGGNEVLVLSGEAPLADADQNDVRVVPGLNYRKTGNSVIAGSLAEALKKEAETHFGSLPDVWHFHNPTLAKNVLIPTVVKELAEEGARIVLQLHDFAEDGRPGNYTTQRSFFDSESSFESTLYPTAKQIHYATINQRDHDFLRKAGISRSNLHVIPNAITELGTEATPAGRPFSEGKKFAIYPTRGIRRKNIGELLLLALIYGDEIDFATSLSPENPEWKPVHDGWRSAVEELELPVCLGIADSGEYSFLDLLGWSDFVVTTSIGEGFGLAFLEPWTAGKSVVGRDLPEITRDFAENQLQLDRLYRRLDFPVAWLDKTELKEAAESMLRQSYLAYDTALPKNAVKQTLKAWVKKGRIDFGVLNESMQLQVLRKLKADPSLLESVSLPSMEMADEATISHHREIIRNAYSLESYGERLGKLYQKVLSGSVGKVSYLPTDKVLAQFLNPGRLNLLRN
ncbi:MAG: glycosyltransferase family 4 protein [Verrucomicrobiales bacterium]|nr:glycosyltransferase family 4 protein [Verrucomicrobiales bacterium]